MFWFKKKPPVAPPKPMHMVGQFKDGGRECIWNNYTTVASALADAQTCFEQGYVCCVLYQGDEPIITFTPGYQPGEHWALPLLPPGATIVEADGERSIRYS